MQGVEVSESVGKHVCVCVFVCGCEQKAQVRDTDRKDMHDLLTALWCVLPKKKEKKKVLCN